MILNSYFKALGRVQLPYKQRQMYMHTFDAENPKMAEGYEDYLVPVQLLLKAAEVVRGTCHMTVDEKVIDAGASQRRPRPHVDGCYIPEKAYWGHGGWNHYCNNAGTKQGRMPVIVAASEIGCKVWTGMFEGEPKSDGDLCHIVSQLKADTILPANEGFWLSPDCVHESMIQNVKVQRTFLRIALPN